MANDWRVALVVTAAALTPLAAHAGDLPHPTLPSVPHTQLRPPAPKHGPYLPVPAGATLVSEVKPSAGGGIDDRGFRAPLSYDEAVGYYDRTFRERGAEVLSRDVAPDGVTFKVRRPDGLIATVIVRKTEPPLIETREPS